MVTSAIPQTRGVPWGRQQLQETLLLTLSGRAPSSPWHAGPQASWARIGLCHLVDVPKNLPMLPYLLCEPGPHRMKLKSVWMSVFILSVTWLEEPLFCLWDACVPQPTVLALATTTVGLASTPYFAGLSSCSLRCSGTSPPSAYLLSPPSCRSSETHYATFVGKHLHLSFISPSCLCVRGFSFISCSFLLGIRSTDTI